MSQVSKMDRVRLLPIELPPASSISGNGFCKAKGKISFLKRLTLGFVVLAALGLLYVPAYHSAQGPLLGIGETPLPGLSARLGASHHVASIETEMYESHPCNRWILEPLLWANSSFVLPLYYFITLYRLDDTPVIYGMMQEQARFIIPVANLRDKLNSQHVENSGTISQLPGWAYNKSRDLSVYIRPGNNTTILSPASICASPPYLLIVICSAVANQKARESIRNTWANKQHLDSFYNSTVRVAFLLGHSDNDTLNSSIEEESQQYSDIIQEKFQDTYNNLTLKSVMMLKWVTLNCENAKYLMKTDDDMFVNVPTLLKTLRARVRSTGTLLGSLICNAKPIQDPKNKWYTPKYMYAERMYPNYLSGTGYVMSSDVAEKLYQAALSTPLLHLEDVYVTGVCAQKAKLRPVNHPGFSYVPRKMDPCVFKNAITAHKVNSSNMYVIWKKLNDANLTCVSQPSQERKLSSLNRTGRNVGYYVVRRRNVNRCV